MLEEKVFEHMKYLISWPENFSAENKYPLIIYLHGAGSRSDSTTILRKNAPMFHLTGHQSRGYVLLAPLCSENTWNEQMSTLMALVEQVRQQEYIDIKRVYLTGNSMGGYGTWELAANKPDWFAAIMPLCGGGLPWRTQVLVNVPIRAFHGLRDTVVDPLESLEMAKAVNRRQGHAELILFPELAHNCWDAVYSNDENYDWLLSFTTDRSKTDAEELSGAQYG